MSPSLSPPISLSLLALLFLVGGVSCQSSSAEFVSLIPNLNNVTNASIPYKGSFEPNGTLLPGQAAQFYTYIDHKIVPNKNYGISVYLWELDSGYLKTANVTVYLKKGSVAGSSSYDDKGNGDCADGPCYFWLQLSALVGKCNPDSGDWYVTVLNTGLLTTYFEITIEIDTTSQGLFTCSFDSGLGDFFKGVLITLGVIVFVIVFSIVACVCVMNRRSHYTPIPHSTAAPVAYYQVPAPAPYPTHTPYAPSPYPPAPYPPALAPPVYAAPKQV